MVYRFASTWNFRSGDAKTATAMLGSLVRYLGTIPKSVDVDFDLFGVVSCAVAAAKGGESPFGASENGFKSSGGVLMDANVPSGEDPSLICAATLRTIAFGGEMRCVACGAMYGHDAAAVTCVVCDSPM